MPPSIPAAIGCTQGQLQHRKQAAAHGSTHTLLLRGLRQVASLMRGDSDSSGAALAGTMRLPKGFLLNILAAASKATGRLACAACSELGGAVSLIACSSGRLGGILCAWYGHQALESMHHSQNLAGALAELLGSGKSTLHFNQHKDTN